MQPLGFKGITSLQSAQIKLDKLRKAVTEIQREIEEEMKRLLDAPQIIVRNYPELLAAARLRDAGYSGEIHGECRDSKKLDKLKVAASAMDIQFLEP